MRVLKAVIGVVVIYGLLSLIHSTINLGDWNATTQGVLGLSVVIGFAYIFASGK